jgi:hypothetical protein
MDIHSGGVWIDALVNESLRDRRVDGSQSGLKV